MFITFEGTEGSGKTTQIALLAAWLREQGFSVVVTREPGGTRIGEQVRGVLHDVGNGEMRAEAEVLLYAAARAQLVGEVIRPALAEGQVVLSDRYADSTLAYQGHGRVLPLPALKQLTQFATGGLRPTRTIYLDIATAEGLRRRQQGQLEMNRMDLQTVAFYDRVQNGYAQMIAEEPDRWLVVDGAQPIERVQAILRAELQPLLAGERLKPLLQTTG
jgi:dTMP kinase